MALKPSSRLLAFVAGLALLCPASAEAQRKAPPSKTAVATAQQYGHFATDSLSRLTFFYAGRSMPSQGFKAQDGKRVKLADFQGKVVVLNLWATWCAPCVKEMPQLDRLQGMYPAEDLAVLTVSIDTRGWRVVAPFWEKHNFQNIQPYFDQTRMLLDAFKAGTVPLTIIYDRQGKEIARVPGAAEWDAKPATDLIATLVAQGKR
ncbi:MAG TPA: TlpA disulfide reductase family protein [Pedomonas sp.]|uniref:TlpA family protein disulfide reductase n=1 Tax=Pedomonas sp. TaxID=2976421 RepID=UPI002F3F805E